MILPSREHLPRLMLVTDRRRTRHRPLLSLMADAAAGGVSLVQIREPDLPDDEMEALVRRVRTTVPARTTIVLNSRAALARTLGCALHLPERAALPPGVARGTFGRSVHDVTAARRAADEGAAYLILGTVYPTASKPGRPGAGPELVRQVAQAVAPLPVFAIGGVSVSRIPELIHAGAWGVAVCSALLEAGDPRRTAEGMALALHVASRPDPD